MFCLRSWRMENPLRSTAVSAARQGSAAIATRTTVAIHPPDWIVLLISISCSLPAHYLCQRRRHPALIIPQGHTPAAPAQLLAGIPHDNRMAGKLKHLNVIMVVTDGHDLFAAQAAISSPALHGAPYGAAGIQHIDHRKITFRIFGAQ